MPVQTSWFPFDKTNTPCLPSGRDLSALKPLYRNFILWRETGSGCVPKSEQEITDLIHFVLEDKSLTSTTRNEYLSQLFRFLDFKNLNYSDAERIMILFISDEELSRNLKFRDLFFSLIDSFKTNNIPGLLELVKNNKKSSVNQQILNQCLIRLLSKLTNRDLSEQNPMSFAITVLTEDTERPEQAYASALYNFISSSFCDGFLSWLSEKDRDKVRILKKNLSSTLCGLANLKLTKKSKNLSPSRMDPYVFSKCCKEVFSIWEKSLSKEQKVNFSVKMSELIVFQILCTAEKYEEQLTEMDVEEEEDPGSKKYIAPKMVEKLDREKKSARRNVEKAKIVADEIFRQLVVKLQSNHEVTVKHLAEIAGRFAQAIELMFSLVTFDEKRKEFENLMAYSDTIAGTSAIRRQRYFLVCGLSSVVLLGIGVGLFSHRGMEFLHTTPGVYAGYLATIGPGTIFSMVSFVYCMLKRRYFFSNPITRAMYDFFDSTFHFSEAQDYKNTEKAEHPISLGSFGVS